MTLFYVQQALACGFACVEQISFQNVIKIDIL